MNERRSVLQSHGMLAEYAENKCADPHTETYHSLISTDDDGKGGDIGMSAVGRILPTSKKSSGTELWQRVLFSQR